MSHSELGASRSTFDLYLGLLAEGMFEVGGQRRGAPWTHLYSIADKKPEWASEVLGLLLRRAVQIAASRGISNPFSVDIGVLNDDQLDDQIIQRACHAAPIAFFHQTWGSIVAIVAGNLDKRAEGVPPYRDEIWRFRDPQFNHRIHEKLLSGVEAGIRALATADFESLCTIAAEAVALRATTIECLLVQGYAVAAQSHPDEALRFLLSDTSRLRVGWHDDPQRPARELIQNATPRCSEEVITELETVLLSYYPDLERTARGWRAVGYPQFKYSRFGSSQYALLSSIEENRRSDQVKRRLREWGRKFGPLPEASRCHYIGELAGPPIRPEATDAMTDDQSLAAIAKHSGPFGMTQEFQRVARNNPSRFGKLVERIPQAAQAAFLEAFIMAMADETVPEKTALAACRIAHELEGRPLGQSIVYCIGKIVLEDAAPDAIDMVCTYIGPSFPEHVRSSAYITLADLLMRDRSRIESALPGLEVSARQVPRGLRSAFCYAMTPLFGTSFQKRIRGLFKPMWSADPWLPADSLMEQFLHLAFRLEYASFREVIEVLLNDAQIEMRVIAGRQSSIAVLVVQEARELNAKLVSGDQHVRKGLADVCAANVRFGKFREFCAERLEELFFDVDDGVRGAASACFRNFTGDELAGLVDLMTAFLRSPSADGYLNSLLDSLKRSTIRHDPVTLRACDLAVEQVIRRKDSAYLELQLCRDLVLRTYHQSADAEIRSRSLDLIDRLLRLEVHGLEGALLEIEARR